MDDVKDKLIEQFKEAVINGDVSAVDRFLHDHPSLRETINEPWFYFDSPAIVIAKSNREMVDVLLKHGADINAKSSWWAGGFGVLHQDDEDMARYLIDRGAQVDAHAAATLGMLPTLEEMVREDPSIVNQRGPDGQVPLHFAKSREVIDFLLDHGADIDMRDIDHGSTPAQYSVDNREKCKYLIERGAEVDIFMACMVGDVELLRGILESDPNCLNARVGEGSFTSGDSDGGHIYVYKIGAGARPLILAARSKDREITELIQKYSSIEQKLLLACLQANEATVKAILSEHPNIVQSLQPEDQSLIADAAWHHQVDAVRTMLEAGFAADARRTPNASTALNQAVIRGYHDIVELLLAHGASVKVKNEYGGTPMSGCIWGSEHFRDPLGDYPAVVESLIRAGAELPDHALGSTAVQAVLIKHGVPI